MTRSEIGQRSGFGLAVRRCGMLDGMSLHRRLVVAAALALTMALPAHAHAAKKKPKKADATLVVDCTAPQSTVLIDGKSVGTTPIRGHKLPAKTYTVTVRKLGHADQVEKVELKAGETKKVIADLLPTAGVLKVTASTKGAEVTVDGKAVGRAPLEVEVPVGKHAVVIAAKGFAPFERSVTSVAGQLVAIDAKLQKGGAVMDDLPLEAPLASAGGRGSKSAAATDDLELAPLGAKPGAELDLPLEAPAGSGASAGGGDLDLAPLPGSAGKLDPNMMATGPGVTAKGEVKPWYLRWYVLTGAAGVVVTGTVAAILLTRGDDEKKGPAFNGELALCASAGNC